MLALLPTEYRMMSGNPRFFEDTNKTVRWQWRRRGDGGRRRGCRRCL